MRLIADESVDAPVVRRLREEGHDVDSVAELSPSISDSQVLQLAHAQRALLLTADKDFGELAFRRRLVHAGVVLLRLAGLPNATKARMVAELVREHATELTDALTVISPGQIRIRRSS